MTTAAELDGRLFLTEAECWDVLSSARAGLLDFTRHGLPAPLPVRMAVRGADVVVRPDPGTKVARALDASEVALTVEVPSEAGAGSWRVVVVGRAALSPGLLVRIHPTDVTGHRLL